MPSGAEEVQPDLQLFVGDRGVGGCGNARWKRELQAKAGVKDQNTFQMQKFSVTQTQRLSRWVGT